MTRLLPPVLTQCCEFKSLLPHYGKLLHSASLTLPVFQFHWILFLQQVKENFARIQACISELRSLPREGCFPQGGNGVVQAVQDGLQQFKQYSRHTAAGSSANSSVEVRKDWEGSRSCPLDLSLASTFWWQSVCCQGPWEGVMKKISPTKKIPLSDLRMFMESRQVQVGVIYGDWLTLQLEKCIWFQAFRIGCFSWFCFAYFHRTVSKAKPFTVLMDMIFLSAYSDILWLQYQDLPLIQQDACTKAHASGCIRSWVCVLA